MPRRKSNRESSAVEVNLTAMLDMAFQLLAFFVLTYRPDPEIKWDLAVPPAESTSSFDGKRKPGERADGIANVVDSLVVSVRSNAGGQIGKMSVGDVPIATLAGLDARLDEILTAEEQPFEQVVIQVGSNLHYLALTDVINVCANQRVPKSARGWPRLSFVELNE